MYKSEKLTSLLFIFIFYVWAKLKTTATTKWVWFYILCRWCYINWLNRPRLIYGLPLLPTTNHQPPTQLASKDRSGAHPRFYPRIVKLHHTQRLHSVAGAEHLVISFITVGFPSQNGSHERKSFSQNTEGRLWCCLDIAARTTETEAEFPGNLRRISSASFSGEVQDMWIERRMKLPLPIYLFLSLLMFLILYSQHFSHQWQKVF